MFGSGHWRVMHQVSAIRFCLRHGDLLHDRCEKCHAVFAECSKSMLPGDSCPDCGSQISGSSLPTESSKGYTAFAQLVERALIGDAPNLAPQRRNQLFMGLLAAADYNADALLEALLAWWDVDSLQALNAQLQCRIEHFQALQLFACGPAADKVASPFLMAAVAFAQEFTPKAYD